MTNMSRRARSALLDIECAIALTAASLRIALTSRDRLVASFGTARPSQARPRSTPPPPFASEAERLEFLAAREVGHTVERIARRLPWRPTCLRQALATRWLLRRRGIPTVMHLGVASAREMDAHAWVTVHHWSVVGRRWGRFTPVASFDG
jgi:hypothetical protein